ncbi:MAG: hypothetical protein HS115_11430 [Spirochaetales bacterium]|nr:hypothetical protein [Spirochaetales bacterium]
MQNLAAVVLECYAFLVLSDDADLNADRIVNQIETISHMIENFSPQEKAALSAAALERLEKDDRRPAQVPKNQFESAERDFLFQISRGEFSGPVN